MRERILHEALRARVYDVAIETPLERAPIISARLDNEIYLKREDLQPVFSFKLRGAYHKMSKLPAEALGRGVVCASAGNHAQGVALAARRLGCTATIVMPRTTPSIKVEAVRSLGGEVLLEGDNYDEASAYARQLSERDGKTYVHPYDDEDVIAGQATIGLELLKQMPDDVEAVFIAVGGGGLIAGIGSVLKQLKPSIRIIAVEPEDADSFTQAFETGERVILPKVGRFADGVAVRQVGATTFEIARDVVDECIVVSNDAICAAIKDIFEDRRAILEPAGALAFAGVKAYIEANKSSGRKLVAIACGANVNFDTLRHVSERAEIGEQREAVLAVTIPERPGAFRAFCRIIGERAITEFNYRYADSSAAHVFVGIRVGGPAETSQLVGLLRSEGYDVLDLTNDETAKLHVRHMVGGRAPGAGNEVLTAFTFPERAGALMQFLDAMQHPWNISLFHYRNHGSDYGRVLAGIQVPAGEMGEFRAFLDRLGYEWQDESANPACRLFLK